MVSEGPNTQPDLKQAEQEMDQLEQARQNLEQLEVCVTKLLDESRKFGESDIDKFRKLIKRE